MKKDIVDSIKEFWLSGETEKQKRAIRLVNTHLRNLDK